MIDLLPTVNACLNATSALLLILGRKYIKSGDKATHKKFMIAAFSVSILFLISYLTYHSFHGSTKFAGEGIARTIYFTILISHTILAAAVPPLAIITLIRGLKNRIDKHRVVARWTYPIWLYVSVTGVIVYLMLYQIYV
jgi:putative membrane protein